MGLPVLAEGGHASMCVLTISYALAVYIDVDHADLFRLLLEYGRVVDLNRVPGLQ